MPRPLSIHAVPILVVVVGIAAACATSKSTGPTLTPQQLVGTYNLDTLATANVTTSPPQVAGTLVLTDSTYHEHVVIQTGQCPGDTTQLSSDSGTYSVSGSTFTQTSETGLPSVVATASLRGNRDTLDVTVTSPAEAAGTYVWVRAN